MTAKMNLQARQLQAWCISCRAQAAATIASIAKRCWTIGMSLRSSCRASPISPNAFTFLKHEVLNLGVSFLYGQGTTKTHAHTTTIFCHRDIKPLPHRLSHDAGR